MNQDEDPTRAAIDSYKNGFRLRWRAKLERYPAPIRYAGFTLIELSVSIVIIGLIFGGVLIGYDMMKAANWLKLHSDLVAYEIAAQTFEKKYGALPGDLHIASSFWGQYCQKGSFANINCNGNGNRYVNVYDVPDEYDYMGQRDSTMDREHALYWRHLFLADLIPDELAGWVGGGDLRGSGWTNITLPQTSFNLGIMAGAKAYWVGVFDETRYPNQSSWGVQPNTSAPWTTDEVRQFDEKFDDGKVLTGRLTWARRYSGTGNCYSGANFASGSMCVLVYHWK